MFVELILEAKSRTQVPGLDRLYEVAFFKVQLYIKKSGRAYDGSCLHSVICVLVSHHGTLSKNGGRERMVLMKSNHVVAIVKLTLLLNIADAQACKNY